MGAGDAIASRRARSTSGKFVTRAAARHGPTKVR